MSMLKRIMILKNINPLFIIFMIKNHNNLNDQLNLTYKNKLIRIYNMLLNILIFK